MGKWVRVRRPDGAVRPALARRRLACQVGRAEELIEAVEVEWPGMPGHEDAWRFPAIVPLTYCEEVPDDRTGHLAEAQGCQAITGWVMDGEVPMS